MLPEDILEWFRFADMDLALAEYVVSMHPQPLESICYHCQQAAEKYLKGFLLAKGMMPPRTHECQQLCDMCVAIDPAFEELDDACETLTQYGVQPRYPHKMEIETHHMRQALRLAQQIKTFSPLVRLRETLEQEQNQSK